MNYKSFLDSPPRELIEFSFLLPYDTYYFIKSNKFSLSKASFGDKTDVDCDFVDDYYPCKSFWIKSLDLRGKHSNHFWRCIMNAFLTREKFSEMNVRVEFHSIQFNFLE